MSCQKNANQAAGAAKQNGITSQASKVGQVLALKGNEKLQAQPGWPPRAGRVKEILERQAREDREIKELLDEVKSLLNDLERLLDGQERGDQEERGAEKEKSPAQPALTKELLDEVEGGDQKKGGAEKKRTPTALSGKAGRVKADRKAQAARVKLFHQAIQQKQKVSVRYRSPKGMRKYTLVPLDVKAGQSDQARKNKYMWGYSENAQTPISLRLDRVLAVKQLDEASFDPVDLAKTWKGKKVEWNLPREW